LKIVLEAIAQAIQPFCDFLSRMTRKRLRADIDLDTGNNAGVEKDFYKGRSVTFVLTNRLVVENRAVDAIAQTARGQDQLPIGASRFEGLRNPRTREAAVAGRIALVHREEPLVAGDQRPCDLHERLRIHLATPHLQLRISGKSWPCLSM
jgi:hypothetical protein